MKKIHFESVDILSLPDFKKTGVVKDKNQAYTDNDWIATFNFWIIQSHPAPAILLQQRSHLASLEASKLDVTVGGHYKKGETMFDGAREIKEELGKSYSQDKVTYFGRRIYFGIDKQQRLRKNIVYVFGIIDNSSLNTYRLQKTEVDGLYILPINKILALYSGKIKSFIAKGIDHHGDDKTINVNLLSFPHNWDNYFYKFAILSQRMIRKEKHLLI